MRRVAIGLVVALLLAIGWVLYAQNCPNGRCPNVSAPQKHPAAIVQVRTTLERTQHGQKFGLASGVILAKQEGVSTRQVLTAGHCTRGNDLTVIVDGVSYPAAIQAVDDGADMAVITIADPGCKGYSLAETVPANGTEVIVAGFPRGQYNATSGSVTGESSNGHMELSAQVTEGYSGGPILNRSGFLVGILTWRQMTNSPYSPGSGPHCVKLRELLRRVIPNRPTPALPVPPTACDPVIPAPPFPYEPPQDDRIEELESQIAELRVQIAAIQPIPGPPGKPGKDGLPGKDGVNGKDGLPGMDGAPTDPSKLPPIRFQVLDDQGNVRQDAEARLGDLVVIKPVLISGAK